MKEQMSTSPAIHQNHHQFPLGTVVRVKDGRANDYISEVARKIDKRLAVVVHHHDRFGAIRLDFPALGRRKPHSLNVERPHELLDFVTEQEVIADLVTSLKARLPKVTQWEVASIEKLCALITEANPPDADTP